MNLQNQHETDNTAEQTSDKLTTAAASRRKFLVRASAASLPVIASVQSGSAWGCVDLKCTPGQAALSTSGSAVASAVANKVANYPARPQWSTLATIKLVLTKDFDSWLYKDFSNPGPFKYKNGSVFESASKINSELDWYTIGTNFGFYRNADSTPYVRSNNGREIGVKVPAIYNGKVIKSGVNLSDVFPGVFSGTLNETKLTSGKYRYVLAAVLGAIWERHPEYIYTYGDKKCYPDPQIIINKFKFLDPTQKADMNRLFEYYSEGTINGRVPG